MKGKNVFFEKNVVCLHVLFQNDLMIMRKLPLFLGIILVSCMLWTTSCERNKVTCGTCKFELLPDSIMDVDYNLYSQVKIGNQVWLGENLRCTHYADGSPIDMIDTMVYARYAFPFGQVDSVKKYGILYNWAAARHLNDSVVKADRVQGLCPQGFHLPTDEEWRELVYFVSNCSSTKKKTSVAKSLAAHDSLWHISTIPNTPGFVADSISDTNNTSLFAAIPVGNCFENVASGELRFYNFSSGASFWSSTPYSYRAGDKKLTNPNAYGRYIGYNDVVANKSVSNKKAYFSIRCVKDK